MGRAKEIVVKTIPSKMAINFIKKYHYSGKVVNNSNLHFGVFLNGKLYGAMSFGPSLDKRKIMQLVEGTKWNEFLELNRMAFSDVLPRNSESRAISQAIKLIKKNAPHIKWIISFADGCSCGDGTIYRASNFNLIDIKKNTAIIVLPNGEKVHKISLRTMTPRKELQGRTLRGLGDGKQNINEYLKVTGGEILEGYQLKYIYFIDKSYKEKLTVPIIPFSKIDEIGAGMYKGEKISISERRNKTNV